MKKIVSKILIAFAIFGVAVASAQIKQTKEQILFYTSDWKGERFPDGRPKVADNLLERALDVSIEDVWDFLRAQAADDALSRDASHFLGLIESGEAARGGMPIVTLHQRAFFGDWHHAQGTIAAAILTGKAQRIGKHAMPAVGLERGAFRIGDARIVGERCGFGPAGELDSLRRGELVDVGRVELQIAFQLA